MANTDIIYTMEFMSTKELQLIRERADAELDKRRTQNQEYANQIFNLIDDIRSEEGCIITFKNAYNEFTISPDDDFYVTIDGEESD